MQSFWRLDDEEIVVECSNTTKTPPTEFENCYNVKEEEENDGNDAAYMRMLQALT